MLNKEAIAEITLGVCDGCDNYVPFIRMSDIKEARVFKCLSCNHQYRQLVNGKIQFVQSSRLRSKGDKRNASFKTKKNEHGL